MPKRRSDRQEDKWRRKLRKYEDKLKNQRQPLSSEDERDMAYVASSSPNPQRSHRRAARDSSDREMFARPCVDMTFESQTSVNVPEPPPATPPPPTTPPPASATQPHTNETSPQPYETPEAPPLADPDLLQALGIFEAETDEWGPNIIEELAKRWEPTLKDGLKKEVRDEIFKKYPYPKNCPLIKPPTLNPEISAVLNESAKNRDNRLLKKQAQLGCAFTILSRTMSEILTKSISTPEVLKNLSDMAKILADSHYLETETRRSLITPMVDKSFIEPFKDRKRDGQLFGDKLGEFIKSSRGLQRTGKLIQPTPSNLNSKGPASRYQQQRPSRPTGQVHRAGEMRAPQYQQYRRRPPGFQPSLHHRAQAPPPAMTASGLSAAQSARKQASAATYKRKQ